MNVPKNVLSQHESQSAMFEYFAEPVHSPNSETPQITSKGSYTLGVTTFYIDPSILTCSYLI